MPHSMAMFPYEGRGQHSDLKGGGFGTGGLGRGVGVGGGPGATRNFALRCVRVLLTMSTEWKIQT